MLSTHGKSKNFPFLTFTIFFLHQCWVLAAGVSRLRRPAKFYDVPSSGGFSKLANPPFRLTRGIFSAEVKRLEFEFELEFE